MLCQGFSFYIFYFILILFINFILSFYPTDPLHIYYVFQFSVFMRFKSLQVSGFWFFSLTLFILFVLSNSEVLEFYFILLYYYLIEAFLFSKER